MKIVLFDGYRLGLVKEAGGRPVGVIDASPLIEKVATPQSQIEWMIAVRQERPDDLEQLLATGSVIPFGQVRLRAPTPSPMNVLGMRVNFKEGSGSAGPLRAFAVSPGAILDPGGTTVLPQIDFLSCRHEAELVCVIGKETRDIPQDRVMAHVFGYMAGVDIGIFHKDDWGPFGKSCDGFKPIGPWIVTADEVPNPEVLQVTLRIDGELRQSYNTSDMAHPVAECVSWLSTFMTLRPGDILFMGTNHQQVGPLQDGNSVEMAIEQVGSFTFDIRDPLHRHWDRDVLADIGQRAIAEKDTVGRS